MRAFLAIILIVLGLGFYHDWLRPGRSSATMRENTGQAEDRLQSLGGTGQQTGSKDVGKQAAIGWVKKVEAADSRFVMTTVDNEKVTVQTGLFTLLRLNGRDITLTDLQIGDQVSVAYDLDDRKNMAASVTVERRGE
jgi:hypothetical protein